MEALKARLGAGARPLHISPALRALLHPLKLAILVVAAAKLLAGKCEGARGRSWARRGCAEAVRAHLALGALRARPVAPLVTRC